MNPDSPDAADRDHRLLLGLIDQYAAGVAADAPRAQQIGLVERLMKAARSHVDTEEAAMRAGGYPGAPRHYAAHRHLLSGIANLLFALRGTLPAPESGFALKEWLATHLAGEDASFHAWLDGIRAG